MKIINIINACGHCRYYHKENKTCQSKKCLTSDAGYVTWFDRLYCKHCRNEFGVFGINNYAIDINGVKEFIS